MGSWIGTLQIGPSQLRIVFNIKADSAGAMSATLDSPDQGATGIPVSGVVLKGDSLMLGVLAVGGEYAGRLEAGDTTITGTWRQGGMSLPLIVRRSAKPPALVRPQTPVPPYPYREEDVSYESLAPGIRLTGTLTIPPGNGPFPAIILISGSGAQDRDETIFGHKPFLVLADDLTRRGFAVLRVDDRGVGGSTGNTMESTPDETVRDVMAGVKYLKGRSEINAARIGLIGHSEGGLVAPLAASRSKEIAFIGLLAAPGVPGDQILLRQTDDVLRSAGSSEAEIERAHTTNARIYATMKAEKDSALLAQKARAILTEALATDSPEARGQAGGQAAIDRQVVMITSPWFRFFVGYDPRPALRSVTCPVLVLHGEKDIQVAAGENQKEIRKALTEGGNSKVQASILPGLNHLFQTAQTGAISEYGTIEETFAPAALEAIGSWTRVVTR
jgi:pimeloyl-ACP methyl ester carboxylesterase